MFIDWADPQAEPDENIMSSVKVLYARNLSTDLSQENLKQAFEEFGKVKKNLWIQSF